jgi:DNA-binding NarL/FixJ family response regulator
LKVLIADDSALLRTRLSLLVSELPGVELIGQTATAGETIETIQRLKPNVVILDISMPGGGGLQVLETLRLSETAPLFIILTAYACSQYRQRCLELGASYFFNKTMEFDGMLELIRQLPKNQDESTCPV